MARIRSLVARSPDEMHRVSTPLELFMDLCFVVAVAQAAVSLHHALGHGHTAEALIRYPLVFFAIWWAWMNFTWFASAYDNDDVLYRLAVFVQIAGVLVIAAGIPSAFDDGDFALLVVGYVIMRLSMVALWWRAASSDPERRVTALRYAGGIALVQVGWCLALLAPGAGSGLFLLLIASELCVPVFAERAGPTTWHPHHIAERYGGFTIIVLGESILSTTVAVRAGIDVGHDQWAVLLLGVGDLVVVCAMWWIYFSLPAGEVVHSVREQFGSGSPGKAYLWGYGHYLVFAAAAAAGAGVAIGVDNAVGGTHLSPAAASLEVAVPVAIYVVVVRVLHRDVLDGIARWTWIPASVAVVAAGMLGAPLLVIGALLVAMVAAEQLSRSGSRSVVPPSHG